MKKITQHRVYLKRFTQSVTDKVFNGVDVIMDGFCY